MHLLLNNSIQVRLAATIGALALIIAGLALAATLTFKSIDEKFERVDQKWLASTEMLGELADRISEFRLAETYRALAPEKAGRDAAERLASEHRDAIDQIRLEYFTLNGGAGLRQIAEFNNAWNKYLEDHDAWVNADGGGTIDGPALQHSAMHQLYIAADKAIDTMLELNSSKAHQDAVSVDLSIHRTIAIIAAACVAGILVSVGLLIGVRKRITKPLSQITLAMTGLAGGHRNIVVPEMNRRDEIGALAKAFDVFRANTSALELAHEATRAAQEQAHTLARHDALTGLPNRRLFNAELEGALELVGRGEASYLLLMIDLDRFKPVNDLLGHAIGDLVLCEVAKRITALLSEGDIAARLGGDEFAVIVKRGKGANTAERAANLARRILASIAAPISIGEQVIEIGASIGIAVFPGDCVDAEGFLRAADIAMYRAKKDGRGRYCFFEPSMDDELRIQATRESDLRRAIADNQIIPHYQPLIDIQTGEIYGFEMLARWTHPLRGAIAPDVFIRLAEQLGLISDLTWALLKQAFRDAKQWDEGVVLAVNISPIQLKDPAFPLKLLAMLADSRFSPLRLEIEITESALVEDVETTKQTLASLQGAGVKVALDDFGTGYSSLSNLRELKFDKIKIDKSFVQTMRQDEESEKIVAAILSLAGSLSLPTVAEGIEDVLVLEQLVKMGCSLGQGYYFGKAMDGARASSFAGVRQEIVEDRQQSVPKS